MSFRKYALIIVFVAYGVLIALTVFLRDKPEAEDKIDFDSDVSIRFCCKNETTCNEKFISENFKNENFRDGKSLKLSTNSHIKYDKNPPNCELSDHEFNNARIVSFNIVSLKNNSIKRFETISVWFT